MPRTPRTLTLGEREDCVNPRHLVWMTRTENEHHKRTYNRSAHA